MVSKYISLFPDLSLRSTLYNKN